MVGPVMAFSSFSREDFRAAEIPVTGCSEIIRKNTHTGLCKA
jgi:hypothetical protein